MRVRPPWGGRIIYKNMGLFSRRQGFQPTLRESKTGMKKAMITIAVTIIFWMVIARAVTGCYTAICKGYPQ